MLQATHDAQASFLCRAFSYISMVGWAGASQDAPVSCNTGKVNLVQSTTHEIDLSGGGFITRYRRMPLWLRSPLRHTRHLLFLSVPLRISPYSPVTAKPLPKP
ncbi:TPA: ash family protein [Citrobacter braakii]|uniref:ash family protein n=1 Tax=Citrobacter sp. KTE151 TaxID=1169322 RepID=UPI001E3AFBAA|nr:ash family protein [Citrobacter sp. KTE151]